MSTGDIRNVELWPAGDSHYAFELGWIGRTIGGAERRQVVLLAVGFDAPTLGGDEDIASAVVARHQSVSSVVLALGGEIIRADSGYHLVAWGHRTTRVDDARFAVSAALELAGEGARCGLDAGIATTLDPTYEVPSLPFVCPAIEGAIAQLAVAQAAQVLISETMRLLLDDDLSFERSERACNAWLIVEQQPRERLAKLIEAGDPAFERPEMRHVLELWRAVLVGQSCLTLITGDRGCGKSAVVHRLCREVAASDGGLIYVECHPEDALRTLAPLRELAARLEELPSLDREAAEALAALNAVLDQQLDPRSVPSDDVRVIAGKLGAALVATAKHRPMAVVIEDVDRADEATRACLSKLVHSLAGNESVLMAVTATTGSCLAQAESVHVHGWNHLSMQAWSTHEIERVLLQDPVCSSLHHDAIVRVASHSEGNLGLALELGRVALAIGGPDARYRILSRPNKLNPMFTSRLDALGLSKPLAQAAALVGNRFDSRILAMLLHMEQRSVEALLDTLVVRGLLSRRGG